uniref:Uncharacterized protein n=1 Tax=Mycena chlorophos TaxID=658473 RepID=A0ABQ0LDE3_MYCCL|nr:predicted protein [Mycena chlorophos]
MAQWTTAAAFEFHSVAQAHPPSSFSKLDNTARACGVFLSTTSNSRSRVSHRAPAERERATCTKELAIIHKLAKDELGQQAGVSRIWLAVT